LILFCDTSALVKLFVLEDDSDVMADRAAASEAIAVCRLVWVEIMSAMARTAREQPEDAAAIARARRRVATDWPRFLTLEVTPALIELAGEYAEAFALRAYDSVQLAAAQTLHQEIGDDLRFACYDGRLVKAAKVLGIKSI
jgi:uncharacterized protein